jgi:hypothetical protein
VLEEIGRRAVSGVVWGLAVSLVLRVTQGKDGVSALRPIAKTAIKGAVIAGEKLREVAEEARETLEDIYAETRVQREGEEAALALSSEEEAIAVEMDSDADDDEPHTVRDERGRFVKRDSGERDNGPTA